jgi:hypothetical protein
MFFLMSILVLSMLAISCIEFPVKSGKASQDKKYQARSAGELSIPTFSS